MKAYYKKEKKEANSFERIVDMFKDMGADCVYLSHYDKNGIVTGEPCDSKTGRTWAMAMVSSIEEALECKYPLVADEPELCDFLSDHRKLPT